MKLAHRRAENGPFIWSIREKFALARCKRMFISGRDVDDVLELLRKRGFSKVLSIAALADLRKVGLGDARHMVHASKAWNDGSQRDDKFTDAVVNALEQEVKPH